MQLIFKQRSLTKTMRMGIICFVILTFSAFTTLGWTFTSCSAGYCKIKFPTTVKTSYNTYANKTSYLYTAKYQRHNFQMTCIIYNNDARAVVEDATQRILTSHLAKRKTTIIEEKVGQFINNSKEVHYIDRTSKQECILQVLVNKNRIYKLEVISAEGKLDASYANQFFGSFGLLS